MAITRNPLSSLIYSQLFEIGDTLFWDKTRPPEIEPADDDIEYIVREGDRIDNLAYEFLGSVQLWWVIMRRNELRLVPNDLVPGATIFIPARDSLGVRGII